MKAVRELSPRLPHFQNITLAFIRGSLATWERFSSEFAPGGLIDEATPAEKLLAWRPATNDINEGILGYYRVTMRGKPSLTLHQFNAMAMYERNDTLSFMNVLFEEEDYQFIRKVAREIDSSGLEAKRREAQVQFHRQLVEINLKKEEARKQKAREQQERMKSIPLIRDISELDGPPRRELDEKGSGKWTGYNLDLQLDALRYRMVPLPKKKDLTRVVQKREAVIVGFSLYLQRLKELGRVVPQSLGEEKDDTELEIVDEPMDIEEIEVDD
ncbi:hypothetical protein FB446DRAFT_709582 [Lentinula raphanica]|nr:hypothetical protein FB446DRAFT_709582 [Lentinula raphanica]